MSVPHDSAKSSVLGTATFIDDRLPVAGELQVAVIFSRVSHGKIRSIEFKRALDVPGVIGIFTGSDFKHNLWGSIFIDQPVLAVDQVNYFGEPVCIIAAENAEALRKAKKLVKLDIEVLPSILTIEEARNKKQFIGPKRKVESGDVVNALKKCEYRLKGVFRSGGQDHFYLESQCSIAYPGEDGQIEIHTSSQHPTEVQHVVAECLGLGFKDVVVVVKRMGGGFGGKESQGAPFAAMAALVAKKTGRAARLVLSKDDDMIMTGKRHPFESPYEVGFDSDGRIKALTVDFYSDGGAYADLSTAIMERAMLHADNAYFIPNVRITGQVCRTNNASNTAFRGFGGPQGVALIEGLIEDISVTLKKDAFEIRRLNCYQKKSNTTPYGQKVTQEMLPRLFDRLYKKSQYQRRRKSIESFNKESRTHVRGLSMTAVKFGIAFTTKFLNQGAALVNIHLDGSLQVSTGATEMGQGVNTKIAQALADLFSIDPTQVRVMPTSTEKIHNTSPTAASSGADINGAAALKAGETLKRRLRLVARQVLVRPKKTRGRPMAASGTQPEIIIDETKDDLNIIFKSGWVFDKRKPKNRISFSDLIHEAWLNRVSLGAYGFFRYSGIHFNKETGRGEPFFYFTNGVAVSEVSVDRLTGEAKVLRTDLLMDLGRPLNKGIDLGQVTGAFVQGLGWVLTERLAYDSTGKILTYSPSTYKIPGINDLPREFNVELLENDENEKNFVGNKAVGEPPLLLGISVWTALKDALKSVRAGEPSPNLRLPAGPEEFLSHC